jgi:hypothetical protein
VVVSERDRRKKEHAVVRENDPRLMPVLLTPLE